MVRSSRSTRAAGLLAAAFLLFHLPFLPASLEDLDSINFALGVRHFDVAQHQPHPPGYPIYIFVAKAVHAVGPSEAHALSLLSIVTGALAILAIAVLFRRLERDPRSPEWAMLATALAATAPLYWLAAARPLSDMPGLAAALGVQALTLTATGSVGLALAAFLAGLGGGIRSQVIWLTVPLILFVLARRPRAERMADAGRVLAMGIVGGLVWFVPLVWLSGGPGAYWRALSAQGSEDLTGVGMLWTTHTPRQLLLALNSTFVAPWASPILAAIVTALAVVGALYLLWRSRPALAVLIAAFGPYLMFDLLFQESITTRYALPLVVPLAYLAVRGVSVVPVFPGRTASRVPLAAGIIVAALVAVNVGIALPDLHAYTQADAPAFRILKDMRAASPTLGAPPVLAMHRRGAVDMRRPITWMAEEMPAWSQRLPSTPKHEWLDLVKYWNDGGRAPIWFIGDPLRSDLALFDRQRPAVRYRWPLTYPILLGGIRPNEMDWHVFDSPGWYLGGGWALTPETAGIADADGRGRGRSPSEGWIRRASEPVTLMIGGRRLSGEGTASVGLSLDDRTIGELTVAPGFFLRMMTLQPDVLSGSGDYAALKVEAYGDVAIEQFDAQPPARVVFGYAEGWHEREYNPVLGTLWRWMSERGDLRVRGTGQALALSLEGTTETFSKPSHVTIRVGDRVIAQQEAGATFSIRAVIPADVFTAAAGEQTLTIETDQVYVPAEKDSGTADRRHLGLKVFSCQLVPVS